MKFKSLLAVFIASVLVGVCAAAGQSPSRAPKPRQQVQKEQPVPAPAVAAPLTPEQMPATPPQVAFNSGQLTIIADNSTLGDILRAVRKQTGASVDVPGNATERVIGRYGPGPARDVLAAMLNGSHFNFVLLGSAANPNVLDRVMLISKSGGGAEPGEPTVAAGQANPMSPVVASQEADNGDTSNDDSAQDASDALADDTAGQADDSEQLQQQATPFAQPNAVKTPEQLLQELQQRQQQLQQQQQQPGVRPGFPTPGVPPQPQPQQ
jgi:hypothetical protein